MILAVQCRRYERGRGLQSNVWLGWVIFSSTPFFLIDNNNNIIILLMIHVVHIVNNVNGRGEDKY